MSTDIFGTRVLDVDLDRREVRFRVFVVYYETSGRSYLAPPVRDPGFFLGLLWESGRWGHPIGEVVESARILDRAWVAEHARWFVSHVERTSVANDPPSEDGWGRLKDFYYERGGQWADEEWLTQADYVVRVTDLAWIQHLEAGAAWGSTQLPINADSLRPEDVPLVPNVHDPLVLRPFGALTSTQLAFSDDGRFLAVAGWDAEIVVYDCGDWSEHRRFTAEQGRLMWAPGRHVVALTNSLSSPPTQTAYDVDTGVVVEVPLERGELRSRSGAHRIDFGLAPGVDFLLDGDERARIPVAAIADAAFAEDESRLFASTFGRDLHVIDPSSRTVVDTIDVASSVLQLALSPSSAYLVTAANTGGDIWGADGHELCVRRLGDREVIMSHWPGGNVYDLAWSPDNRWLALHTEDAEGAGETRVMRIGLPAEPPADLRPPESVGSVEQP
ncbi:WD40 repeat domain-containing protein [Saccharopolyspora sp. NPDC003752]